MTVSANTQPVIHALAQLQHRLSPAGMQSVYEEIGVVLNDNIRLNLGEGKTPFDAPFEPLKKPRKTNRGFGTDVPLNDTRTQIYSRVTFNADGNGVNVGILEDTPIGRTHQFGSPARNTPARPFLPMTIGGVVDLPSDWGDDILHIINSHLSV